MDRSLSEDRDKPDEGARASNIEVGLGAPDAKSFSDTAAIIEKARKSSVDGFEKLWQRFYPALQVTLAGKIASFSDSQLGMKIRAEIPDLLQTTMLKASQHLGDFEHRGPGSFLIWLRQIALNEYKNRLGYWLADRRDVNREGQLHCSDETFPLRPDPSAAHPGPRTLAELDEQKMRVGAALESLDPVHRDILLFRFFAGSSWSEIAEHLDYPSSDAVRMDCTRKALPSFALAMAQRTG